MDDDAIGRLLDVAAGRLAAYGYLLTGSQPASGALVQDAIVKVFVRHRRLDDTIVAEGLVRAAMRTIHLAQLRKAASWRAKPQSAARQAEPTQPPDLAAQSPVGHALALLPAQERAAITLRHHDHLQKQEIAAAMRVPEGVVDGLLSRAHATLERTLGEIAPELDQIPIVDARRRG